MNDDVAETFKAERIWIQASLSASLSSAELRKLQTLALSLLENWLVQDTEIRLQLGNFAGGDPSEQVQS